MKIVRVILLFSSIFLIISLAVLISSIKNGMLDKMFYFGDVGTYNIPFKTVEVNSSNIHGQSFTSNFNNLFMISIFIPKQNLNKDTELYFHLKNNRSDNKDLLTLKWNYNQIHSIENDFYLVHPARKSDDEGFHFHFHFPPIKDSKNKEFYFYFESIATRPGEGIKLGVWDNIDYYEALTKGQMFINDKPVKGFLAFRTYNIWVRNFSLLADEIKDRLLKDKAFLIFYCVSLFIIFSATIAIFMKTKII